MRLTSYSRHSFNNIKPGWRIVLCHRPKLCRLIACAFILVLLSSTFTSTNHSVDVKFATKVLPRALAVSTSPPSVFFSSNFSSGVSPPRNQNTICGNIQIANSSVNATTSSSTITPSQTQQNNTFVCGNNIQNGRPSSNSSFIPTSRFLQISKNLAINKSKSTSRFTFKNITEGPVKFQFVNSYWTDNTAPGGIDAGSSSNFRPPGQAIPPVLRQEVGPGEGNSILAVVLINRGFVDVTSIRGTLELPSGFKAVVPPDDGDPPNNSTNSTISSMNVSSIVPAANPNTINSTLTRDSVNSGDNSNSTSDNNDNIAVASYNGQVDAGQMFVLYFPIFIEPSVHVGKVYHGSLKLHFFTLEQERKINSEFNTASKARAFDVSRPINASTSIEILKSLEKLNARDNSNRKITSRFTPFESNSRTIDIPFKISGKVILDVVALPESLLLNVSRSQSSLLSASQLNVLTANPGSPTRVALFIRNEGSAPAFGVIADILARTQAATANNIITPSVGNVSVTSNVLQQNNIVPLIVLGSSTFNIGSVQVDQIKKVDTAIFPSIAVGGTLEILTIHLIYNDAYGNKKTVDKIVGVQILPQSPQALLNVSPSAHQ